MSQTRIRIDINAGVVEAEGTEAFVLSVYADFKDRLHRAATAPPRGPRPDHAADRTSKQKSAKETTPRRVSKGSTTPKLLKDLDLAAKGKQPGLRDFFAQYACKTNFERNLVFVYYLEHLREVEGITVDHIFTCYRHVPGVKVPKALRQSLVDTSARVGWLDTKSTDNIKVAVAGVNHIEHDLAKAASPDAE